MGEPDSFSATAVLPVRRLSVRLLWECVEFRADSQTDEDIVLLRRGDLGRVDKLAALLMKQGIEVRQLADSARICGSLQPAAAFLSAAGC